MTIRADIQSLAASAIIELFELDATLLGAAAKLYFHAGTNALTQPVVWQGVSYLPLPIEASGFEWSGKGQLPRPKMRVTNVDGLFGALTAQYASLLGAKLTRRKTLAKFLDAVNFPGGINATADITQSYPDEVYFVDRKASENAVFIEFELASALDLPGVMLPRRQFISNTCAWRYRGAECGYAGVAMYDSTDAVTLIPANDACGKRLSSCKARFGVYAVLPFGGFPGTGMLR
jgi:lambda family phage minor tail protein L